jgi:hypothetical protein
MLGDIGVSSFGNWYSKNSGITTKTLTYTNHNEMYKPLTFQFLFTTIQLVLLALLDGSKMGQHLHELTEIHSIIIVGVSGKESMHNTITQWIYGQFWNT